MRLGLPAAASERRGWPKIRWREPRSDGAARSRQRNSIKGWDAIFAKIGVENINPDLATLLRTVVIAVVLATILAVTRQDQPLASISLRAYAFAALSGVLRELPGFAIFVH